MDVGTLPVHYLGLLCLPDHILCVLGLTVVCLISATDVVVEWLASGWRQVQFSVFQRPFIHVGIVTSSRPRPLISKFFAVILPVDSL